MVNEVKLHKQRQSPERDVVALTKAAINVQRGRAGMMLTQREVERGQ